VSSCEASASYRVAAEPAAVWELWEDPGRWPEWNADIAAARAKEPLALGARAQIRFRHSPIWITFTTTAWEPGRVFTDEAHIGLHRLSHEHGMAPAGDEIQVTHVLRLRGRGAAQLGRVAVPRLQAAAEAMAELERQLVLAHAR
jgi:uncharacterized protein YndB with AHSA1/START domain